MNADYYYKRYEVERMNLIERFNDEREYMLKRISYLEERCHRLEEYVDRPSEDVLSNINIEIIEKYLRKKKLENLNKK